MKKILSVVLGALMCLTAGTFAGCAFGVDDGVNDGRTVLRVSYYEAGYGGEWIEQIAAAFEKENPDVRVVLEGDYNMEQYVGLRLENAEQGGDVSDIYTTYSRVNFTNYAQKGYLEDLSDLYEEETPDGVKLKDVILPDALKTSRVDESNTYWGVPWTTSVSGFIYNAKLFRQHPEWDTSPETLEDFLALCKQIADAEIQNGNNTVAPFVYSGATEHGYFAHQLKSWFRMYQGEQGFNEFYEYESADVYKMEGRKKAYEALAQVLGSGYAMRGCTTMDYLNAQRQFIMGNAAMISAGSWLETEMSGFLEGYPDFEMGIMPMPKIYAEERDGKYYDLEGKEVQHINSGAADNFIIPKHAKQKELAKEFLLFMASQDMLTLYTQYTNSPRPYKYENTDWSDLSTFGQSVMQTYQESVTVAPVSFAPIATSNWVQEYMGTGAFAVALDRFTTGSLEGSLAKAVELWKDECDYAEERFESYLQ